jgi:hypothetical protein
MEIAHANHVTHCPDASIAVLPFELPNFPLYERVLIGSQVYWSLVGGKGEYILTMDPNHCSEPLPDAIVINDGKRERVYYRGDLPPIIH